MKLGSLFSGGGLGDFGFMAAGMEITWQCEIDDYCQNILALRYPESKKYTDIKKLKGAELEKVDIITGGFPCQPFSVAGQQMGKSDDRHLWPEMFRIIQEVNPRWVVGENVSGFVDMALDDVCANLESASYETTAIIFPAHALGAWHRRERVWIVGYSEHSGWNATKERRSIDKGNENSTSWEKQTSESTRSGEQYEALGNPRLFGQKEHEKQTTGFEQSSKNVADTTDAGIKGMCERKESAIKDVSITHKLYGKRGWTNSNTQGWKEQIERSIGLCGAGEWRTYWKTEPTVGRVANGIADRIHRLKMLGNGQVPACTYVIGKMIMDIENNH